MSKHRYIGGIISATQPTPTQASASGVWTLDEAEYYQKAGNWPGGSGADPYFQYNALLLHGDGTNGAQNNTFLDGSTNNFTITRNGNTTQGSFVPYVGPGCWSNFYAATSSGWQTPASSASTIIGSAFNATATFTVEAWIYPLSRHSGGGAALGYVFGQMQLAGSSVDWSFGPDSNGNLVLFWYNAGNQISKGSSIIPLNTWTHIALTVTNGAIKMFVNGVQETLTGLTSTTASSTVTNYCSSGGYLYAGTTWQGFNGYISNLRVVAKRAVYSANFTPSTTPLIATTDTTLLVNNQNAFTDMSGSGWALTTTGGVQVSKFSPFTFYQINPKNYSGYFDGTGDYVTYPTGTGLILGGMDFTIEAWVYPTARVTNSAYIVAQSSYGVGTDFIWWINSAGNLVFYALNAGANFQFSTTAIIPLGAWTHVAVVRSGSFYRMYVNGVADGSITNSSVLTNSYLPFTIGNSSNNTGSVYFPGSISNLRVTKGLAVYTANFTPPAAALTNTTTVSNAQSWSTSFDGAGDYLNLGGQGAFAFGSLDFTIEMWIFPTAGTSRMLYDGRPNSSVGLYPTLYINSSNFITYYTNGADRITGAAPVIGAWQHIALVRVSGVTKLYINGTQSGSSYTDSNSYLNGAARPIIGADGGNVASQNFAGFISNLRVVNGQGLYTTSFTPSTTPLTTTSQGATATNVSLLTCQNNILVDNSSNRFQVTPTGDAKPTSINPFVSTNGIGGTSYSGMFDGTGDYLTSPTSAGLNLGAGDFTIEGWAYLSGAQSSKYLFGVGTVDGTTRSVAVWIGGTQKIEGYFSADGSTWASYRLGTTTIAANQWIHVAFVRSGSTLYLFLNGVLEGTQTGTPTTAASGYPAYIGGQSAAYQLNGYISNVRVIKGSALYTGNFTPATVPLTAVSGTQLLTCQSTTFVDNSGNALTITANGDARTDAFNPFSGGTGMLTLQNTTIVDNSSTPRTLTVYGDARPRVANPFIDTVTGPTPYVTTTYGGSAYFDGTGDYLSSPNINFSSNNFTIEGWFYPTTIANLTNFWGMDNGTGSTPKMLMYISSTGNLTIDMGSVGATQFPVSASASTYLKANAWQHIAIVRAGNTMTMYINGASVSSGSLSVGLSSITAAFTVGYIGEAYGQMYSGFVSNFRIVNGSALYTGPFVPPTAPVTAVTNTQLLLNMTNAGIFDNTTINDLETGGAAQVSTSVVKYGTGSISFNGLNSYLYAINNTALQFATGDYTVEFWVYASSFSTTPVFTDFRTSNGATGGAIQISATTGGVINVYGGSSTATLLVTAGSALTTSTWYHVALTRASGATKLFINGTQSGSTYASDTTSYNLGALWIGSNASGGGNYLNGYLDDVRITKGVARYTANFTPPLGPFPNF